MTPAELGAELAEAHFGRGIKRDRTFAERTLSYALWEQIETLRKKDPEAGQAADRAYRQRMWALVGFWDKVALSGFRWAEPELSKA